MAKRGRPPKVTIGEQLPLIDVGPENLKKIAPHAKRYRQLIKDRLAIQKQEFEEKEEIHRLIKESGLKHLPNGHITFDCEGLQIDVEPRDEVIHVREVKKKKVKKPTAKSNAKTKNPGNAGAVTMADQIAKDEAEHEQTDTKKTRKKKQRTVNDIRTSPRGA